MQPYLALRLSMAPKAQLVAETSVRGAAATGAIAPAEITPAAIIDLIIL
jgi:hypothetical protein